ncbi:N-acetyltransferase [Alkalihalobacillus sp. AL-G]|uniref:GNAT family N-acetyltransferase n=1 Tax=Alkalihalobacillus sp. AL-G TaxID=2926399 RepID=UPI00272A9D34|nr:GNAT family N-acetyltransferase [Alkalihalobacillus sp. AL-G]WLD92934.1 GNAT family N-acetyltransferase [Alkalihalobacillus sp. AL-G]
MIKQIDLSDPAQLHELHQMQKASYQVEADLIGFYRIPPLVETVEELKSCGETFYGYWENERLAGAVSIIHEDDVCTICRLAVHPDFFQRGIGGSMVTYVVDHLPYDNWLVSTGKENHPARRLYEKHGFEHVGDEVITGKGITISNYKKTIDPS